MKKILFVFLFFSWNYAISQNAVEIPLSQIEDSTIIKISEKLPKNWTLKVWKESQYTKATMFQKAQLIENWFLSIHKVCENCTFEYINIASFTNFPCSQEDFTYPIDKQWRTDLENTFASHIPVFPKNQYFNTENLHQNPPFSDSLRSFPSILFRIKSKEKASYWKKLNEDYTKTFQEISDWEMAHQQDLLHFSKKYVKKLRNCYYFPKDMEQYNLLTNYYRLQARINFGALPTFRSPLFDWFVVDWLGAYKNPIFGTWKASSEDKILLDEIEKVEKLLMDIHK